MALQSDLAIKTRDAMGVTFASPSKPDLTVRFKTTSGVKSLGGVTVSNYLTEIIYNDLNAISIGSDTVNDPVSVRLRVSAGLSSASRLSEIFADIAINLAHWESENAFKGFTPSTAPGTPAA
jgi:hypothetical protein